MSFKAYTPPINNGAMQSLDNLVEINSRAAAFKKKGFYRKTITVLLIAFFILLIGFFVVLYFYVNTWKDIKRITKICTSDNCLRSAANLKRSMDSSIDPCDDFYKYTCGKWNKEHPNHGWYSHFSTFKFIDERITMEALNFFNSEAFEKVPKPVSQSRDLYKSCINTDALNALGYSVLFKYLKEVGLPKVPHIFNKSGKANFTFDWIKTEVTIKKVFAMDTFVGFTVGNDLYNRSKNAMYLGKPDNGSPLPSPGSRPRKLLKVMKNYNSDDDPDREKEKLLYKNTVKKVVKVIMANISKVPEDSMLQEIADSLWNVSNGLDELLDNISDSEDDIEVNKLSVDELQRITDEYFRSINKKSPEVWRYYLSLLFDDKQNVTLDLDGEDFIYVAPNELPYLSKVVEYLSETSDLLLELYMWWITVYAMISSTTTEVAELLANQERTQSTVPVYRSRSVECTMLAINFMGVAVSYGIFDNSFANKTKPKVEQMMKDIRDSFSATVHDISWMDESTKQVTLEKTKEMLSFVGYPDWLYNRTAMEVYYFNMTIRNDTFLENMMSIVKCYTPYVLNSLRDEVDRSWKTDPTTVNAYNYFSDNSIMVPIAILTFPVYNLGLEVLNYGAMGSILGHELTHGFDNIGRKFDKYGSYKQWWSNKTITTFEKKTECFIDQYNNYTVPSIDKNVDGKQTLGENLADNGGLYHAYYAYKNYLKRLGPERKLPGFEQFTSDQMFFIAYGSVWCEEFNAKAVETQLESDGHSPNVVRVIGTVQNSNEFAKAFKCPLGSKMNPKRTRCRIW